MEFEKAYDSVSWSYLEYMLRRLGFVEKWCLWMCSCIFSGHVSMLVNESPTNEIQGRRGLRQGDPFSPFLFLVAPEGLVGLVRNTVEFGPYKPLQVNNEVSFSSLQFADNTIMAGETTWENIWSIKAILWGFELVSGYVLILLKVTCLELTQL